MNLLTVQTVECLRVFNFLPNEIILDLSKLTAFVDDKINVPHMMNSVFDRKENIVGKGGHLQTTK